jgi:thioesterase domain-containing protein
VLSRRALAELDPAARRESTAEARDELESTIARVWCNVLGIPRVGVHDNFFEVGGSSLTAVNVMAQIAAETACDLPVTALFQAGTVEQIARLVRERRSNGSRAGSLVKLQPNGSKRPVILIPPAGGSLICYSELARLMAPDQPVWGLEPGRESEHPSTVEAIAERYISELRAQGVAGPWRLSGWSLGGNIAYEMARQLTDAGDTVEVVALIDCHAEHKGSEPEEDDILLEIARVQALAKGAALRIDRRVLRRARALNSAFRDSAFLVASELEDSSGVAPETIARELRTIVQRFRSDIRAGRRYKAGPYSGRVALFRAPGSLWIRDNGWGRRCPALEIYPIPGAHRTILNQPHAAGLANQLREALEPPRL